MKLKADNTEQKLRGAYYTPQIMADFIAAYISKDKNIHTVLEPSCGDGVFIRAIQGISDYHEMQIEAVEIEAEVSKKLAAEVASQDNITVLNKDFFSFYREHNPAEKYDLIIGNPPYIRYQYLDETQRVEMSEILTSNGMKANKLINTWVAFTVAGVQMLSEGGTIAFVIPAEILQVAYADELRLFLANNLSEITIVTFEELVFPDIEQEVVILFGRKGTSNSGIRIVELNNCEDFSSLNMDSIRFQSIGHVREKWTKYFTTIEDNELISQLRSDTHFKRLSDYALINVGVTTGNNKYFSVNQEIVEKYALKEITIPLIGRSAHAHSIYFTENDWMINVSQGKNAYLLNFPESDFDSYSEGLKEYIAFGESTEQNVGYKLGLRDRWYQIPSIWIPDAFFLRRNNLYPKFVLNCCKAISTDTMHRIKFNEGVDPERIMLSYYNSISFAFTEICGRSYGGGVLEILPGEVGNILVPVLDIIPIEEVREALKVVDEVVRNGQEIEIALDYVDDEILVKILGISSDVCSRSRNIWKRMQRRRLKRGKAAGESE